MTITAYLVEPERRTIRAINIDPANSLADIRRHIGCDPLHCGPLPSPPVEDPCAAN